jgi:hypothetical protein
VDSGGEAILLHTKFQEVSEEFRTVVAGRSNIIKAALPPAVFLLLNELAGFAVASWASLAVAAALSGLSLIRKQEPGYALGGLAATGFAILSVRLSEGAAGYFLPSLISGGLTTVICIITVIAGRPLVALTSHLARGWPLGWYWHPQVRPSYSEVTLAWAVFFALRLALQWFLLRRAGTALLGVFSLVMGWPATIVLLVISYLYGTWRLRNLGGPSVEEFKEGADPPWEGQQRGF